MRGERDVRKTAEGWVCSVGAGVGVTGSGADPGGQESGVGRMG